MTSANEGFHRLHVEVGTTGSEWYFDSLLEAYNARRAANHFGVKIVAENQVAELPCGAQPVSAHQFRHETLRVILAHRSTRLQHQDTVDSIYSGRVIDVRNALRSLGWVGGPYDTLQKEDAKAIFWFDHSPQGRNVIGMSINGIEDDLSLPAPKIAQLVTAGANEHLRRNRRIDVQIVAEDGTEGAYSVAYNTGEHIEKLPVEWKPQQPDTATAEVRLRMRRYGRLDGAAYTLSGDTWSTIESNGQVDGLWEKLLSGMPAGQAVAKVLENLTNNQPTIDDDIQHARTVAAMYEMNFVRMADHTDVNQSVGPIVAITPAFVVQNVGSSSALLHPVDRFPSLPEMGRRSKIRYEEGEALVKDGHEQRRVGHAR